MNTLIPWYIKLLSHDLGLRPFKIISLILNKAKCLGGVNTGIPKKNHPVWPATKKIGSHLTRPEPEPTVVSWLCDSETDLLICCLQGRQNCNIYMKRDRSLKLSVLHTTCFTVWTEELYISKSCMQQVLTTWKAVWTDFKLAPQLWREAFHVCISLTSFLFPDDHTQSKLDVLQDSTVSTFTHIEGQKVE